jgi:type II secretory pathway component PulF
VLIPSQLQAQSEFYHQFGTLLAAGIGPVQALDHLQAHAPSKAWKVAAASLADGLGHGLGFAESARALRRLIPDFDLALIDAGEQSGRLDRIMIVLARAYQERATLLRNALAQLAYPVLILHAGIFIAPLPALVLGGNVRAYLAATFGVLVPLYLLVAILVRLCDGRHGPAWRERLEAAARYIPLLGSARRDLALARFALALGSLLNAGVPVIRAWGIAADSSGSPKLAHSVQEALATLDLGLGTPAELASRNREFPSLFATSLLTAEASGKLDDTLERLQRYYADEGARRMSLFATMAPRLLYIVILFVLAAQILDMFMAQQQRLPKF